MKNKLVIIAILVLIVILIGVWLYPSNDENREITGNVASEKTETIEEEEISIKASALEDTELDEISGSDLIDKCLITCGANAKTSMEVDIWLSVCNKKYKQGEEEIREFIRSC